MAESWSNRSKVVDGYLSMLDGISFPNPVSTARKTVAASTVSSRTCNSTPGFFALAAAGKQLPINAFYYAESKRLYPHGIDQTFVERTKDGRYLGYVLNAQYTGVFDSWSWEGLVSPANIYPSGIIERLRDKCTAKLLSDVKNQKADMATTMAEGGKTMGMVVDAMGKVGAAYSAARKGNLTEAAQHLGLATSRRRQRRFNRTARKDQEKAMASAWLELQYGWKPLLQSVYDGAILLADTNAPIFRGIVKASTQEVFGSDKPFSASQDFGTTKIWQVDRSRGRAEYHIKCVFLMVNSSASRAAMSGLTNPAVVAWELVPYSFVIDWFLPIGDWLSLMDATNGLAFHSGCATSYQEGTVSRDYVLNRQAQRRSTTQGFTDKVISRGKLNQFPSVPLPSFKNPATMGHLANAMALFSNLRK